MEECFTSMTLFSKSGETLICRHIAQHN